MDEKQEFRLRRKAIQMHVQGKAQQEILARVQRSPAWLSKWQKRFDQQGMAGLHSRSRRPAYMPTIYSSRMRHLIVQTRRRLVKQKVGLIGARAIRRELRKVSGEKSLPSLATIKRVLRQRGMIARPRPTKRVYFPKPLQVVSGSLHALDWTCRYLEDGPKIYAFHTLNLHTRACTQTIATNKSYETVRGHCLQTWKSLGIPHFLQLDNDAAFCGGYKAPRIFGQFVRLCLSLGIELIFLPVAQPEHNGEVEELNGLWGHAFWERRHFSSFAQLCRASSTFVQWYMTEYVPPFLIDTTPQQAQGRETLHHLTAKQVSHLPDPLPMTAGRIHFIRQVQSPMAPSLSSTNLGKSASVWQVNMFGLRSLPIAGDWKSGINVLFNILGVYSKIAFMTFPKLWPASNPNLHAARQLDQVHDVLNPPRNKIHAKICSRCLGPLQVITLLDLNIPVQTIARNELRIDAAR